MMKILLKIVLIFVASSSVEGKRKKCGILVEKCVLLSSGKIFWPSESLKTCPIAPMCPVGYNLNEQTVDGARACCCLLSKIERCPDCDMRRKNEISFDDWFDVNISRNGPPDGTCPGSKVKRIFFGEGNQLDKCCCEPKNSPYLFI